MYDGESLKSVRVWEPYRMAWLFWILCTLQTWLHSFFGNLSWHWREGDAVTSAQFKNSLLLYAAQTVEKMVDMFIRDRELKECPLWRSPYGSWSATSIETSVHDVIYMHLECGWTWWLQRAFLDNVGAYEALLQLPEHMKLNPLLCGWVSPKLETGIRGPCLMGDRGAECLQAAPVAVLLLLMNGPPGRCSVVMTDIQHNECLILLSW